MKTPFTRKTLAFLRALKRHNDRDWFRARKEEYETHVRQPMIALVGQLAQDFERFAPEMVAEPKVSLYRIYRDTRFSNDKSPLKTHVAARFPARGMAKGRGAGLYLEVAPQWVWMGGGLYMPSSGDLRAIRAHIAGTHPALHRLVTGRTFTRTVGELGGTQLTRVPRGYAKDHPAAHYLRYTQFLVGLERPAGAAIEPSFYRELLAAFRAIAPVVRFLNTALADVPEPAAPPPPATPGVPPRRPTPMW